MRQIEIFLRQILGGAAVAVAFAVTWPMLAIAQETTTTTTQESTTQDAVVTSVTPEMICEAEQRAEARRKKWVEQGIPEKFGSEEPFTFDPTLC